MAMPSPQNAWRGRRDRSRPSRRSAPDSIGCRPAIALMSVVLPAPFGPTTHASSPAPMRSDTSEIAGAAPYETWMRSTSSMGLPQVGGDHVRLPHHRARVALGDDAAVAEHDDAE